MKYKVKNTIDNSVEFFETRKEVDEFIQGEIKWYSSENELKNGNGYDESDFPVFEAVEKYIICDNTSNTGANYIDSNGGNVNLEENAAIFNSKIDAEKFMKTLPNYREWAYITEIEIYE